MSRSRSGLNSLGRCGCRWYRASHCWSPCVPRRTTGLMKNGTGLIRFDCSSSGVVSRSKLSSPNTWRPRPIDGCPYGCPNWPLPPPRFPSWRPKSPRPPRSPLPKSLLFPPPNKSPPNSCESTPDTIQTISATNIAHRRCRGLAMMVRNGTFCNITRRWWSSTQRQDDDGHTQKLDSHSLNV